MPVVTDSVPTQSYEFNYLYWTRIPFYFVKMKKVKLAVVVINTLIMHKIQIPE